MEISKSRKNRTIRLYWWRLDQPLGNFGDDITALLIEKIFGYHCVWAPPDVCDIAGAGSIIEYLCAFKGDNRPVLWGSGFRGGDTCDRTSSKQDINHGISRNDFDIVALRGAHSRDQVIDANDDITLGDPGLLASFLLESTPRKEHTLGVIPHFVDAGRPEVDWFRAKNGVKIINAINDPREVIKEVAKCHYVVSSSLHGLIIADSVATPNAHIRLSNSQLIGGRYKFEDYYSVYNDHPRHFTLDPTIAINGGVRSILKKVDEKYVPPNDIGRIKERLLRSFPL